MHTKEVDLHHRRVSGARINACVGACVRGRVAERALLVDAHEDWHAGDETDELVVAGDAYAQVQAAGKSGRRQGPAHAATMAIDRFVVDGSCGHMPFQKVPRVVESKHIVVVLDVILAEQCIDLVQLNLRIRW